MLMSLGQFVFGLSTAAYSELQRRESWRHAQAQRIGARPAAQFLGPGDDVVTLSGLVAPPVTGDVASIAALRDMAAAGDAYQLVSGAGDVLGAYVIEGLDTKAQHFLPDGTARGVEFELQLRRVDDDDADLGDAW